ncbi:MAG: hypothetical protein COA42_07310 [Alteromonadaceae bacterium]|nr:MAG: hypothetical protein COA42_07310 [Alteromonadaceae bacterium]
MRLYSSLYLLLSFLLFVFSSISVHASNTSDVFEPANLKDSKSSLQNKIKFPRKVLRSDVDTNLVVRCDAQVTRSGKLSLNYCLDKSKKAFPYVVAINNAAKRATIKPGKVNGRARKTWFQYYVVFMKKGDKHSVEVMPNSGLEVNRYGFDYTSAQRYKEGKGNFGVGCGINKHITVNAVIETDGTPSEIKVATEDAGKNCIKYLTKTFMAQKYIPAMVDGVAVRSLYSEQIFRFLPR